MVLGQRLLRLLFLHPLGRCRVVGRSHLCAPLKLLRRRATLGCSLRLFVTLSSCRSLSLWSASTGYLPLALVEAWVWGVEVLFLRVLPSLGGLSLLGPAFSCPIVLAWRLQPWLFCLCNLCSFGLLAGGRSFLSVPSGACWWLRAGLGLLFFLWFCFVTDFFGCAIAVTV